jgi:hypothetical protein
MACPLMVRSNITEDTPLQPSSTKFEHSSELAHFPAVKDLPNFDYDAQPSIDPKQIRIRDRLLHHSHVVAIRGDSYRLPSSWRPGVSSGCRSTLPGRPPSPAAKDVCGSSRQPASNR